MFLTCSLLSDVVLFNDVQTKVSSHAYKTFSRQTTEKFGYAYQQKRKANDRQIIEAMYMKFRFRLISILCAIIATSLAEFPPQYVENTSSDIPAGHLKAFGYHRPSDGPVDEESGFLHPKIFWEKYVSVHKPMVFRKAVSESPAIVNWNDEYLVERFGDLDLLLEVKRENRTKQPQRTNVKSFIERYRNEDIYAVTLLPDPMRADVQVSVNNK